MSTIILKVINELEQEALTTRKMLLLVPEDKYEWQPHQKSMTMIRLATHIAELPSWIEMAVDTDELDFATTPYQNEPIHNNQELLAYFEKSLEKARGALNRVKEVDLEKSWLLRNGDQIFFNYTKYEVMRVALSQTIHHRAQLGVYLRLLNIPIPGSYGPSADEQGM